ncbi:glutaredoxin family protein [Halorubrum ezzemoulense]|uniref:glutaredoxin family protein n=1 Tax=Halorubrum ezzemoulense TaxID=337243 RepID=UPI000BBC28BC|nr:glutaredoxin [Halorubrum ezzemoulense]
MSVRLCALDGCPWCEKAADALDDAGVEYETEWVEALHSDRNEVKRVGGQRGVPGLVDEGRGVTMAESANIVDYVERTLA